MGVSEETVCVGSMAAGFTHICTCDSVTWQLFTSLPLRETLSEEDMGLLVQFLQVPVIIS